MFDKQTYRAKISESDLLLHDFILQPFMHFVHSKILENVPVKCTTGQFKIAELLYDGSHIFLPMFSKDENDITANQDEHFCTAQDKT